MALSLNYLDKQSQQTLTNNKKDNKHEPNKQTKNKQKH